MNLQDLTKVHLAARAVNIYRAQISNGERDIDDVINSFMLDGFKGFSNMTKAELIEWIEVSS